jgi:hypothetical protein
VELVARDPACCETDPFQHLCHRNERLDRSEVNAGHVALPPYWSWREEISLPWWTGTEQKRHYTCVATHFAHASVG